jgi:hypothetical protein
MIGVALSTQCVCYVQLCFGQQELSVAMQGLFCQVGTWPPNTRCSNCTLVSTLRSSWLVKPVYVTYDVVCSRSKLHWKRHV